VLCWQRTSRTRRATALNAPAVGASRSHLARCGAPRTNTWLRADSPRARLATCARLRCPLLSPGPAARWLEPTNGRLRLTWRPPDTTRSANRLLTGGPRCANPRPRHREPRSASQLHRFPRAGDVHLPSPTGTGPRSPRRPLVCTSRAGRGPFSRSRRSRRLPTLFVQNVQRSVAGPSARAVTC